jgi:low affinity Fe/Cu permease
LGGYADWKFFLACKRSILIVCPDIKRYFVFTEHITYWKRRSTYDHNWEAIIDTFMEKIMEKESGVAKANYLTGAVNRFAGAAASASGSTSVFLIALGIILVWLVAGPWCKFSERWQMIINTTTSIITFLMVFLIQKAQNKDFLALQIKLNELVSAHKLASNQIINVEDLTEEELQVINKYYSKLAATAREVGKKDTKSEKP